MITTLAFGNYRSLRDLRLSVGGLTVITGGNGTGKSNVYRALRLLVDAANGELARALAREGGLPSAMWAGEPSARASANKTEGKRLSIGFADDDLAYELRMGIPPRDPSAPPSAFELDPEVKAETVRTVGKPKVNLLERRSQSAMLRDHDGHPVTFSATLDLGESVLSQLAEPHRYPILSALRERLRRWRFYHQIRTDAESPVRAIQIGTRTPVLSHDGHDLAAALQTIIEIGDERALAEAVAEAFDGATLSIASDQARFRILFSTPGVFRPLDAAELSDGTLRYLALLAALQSPRPPELLVLNEPEASLHPSVLVPLGRQIIAAAKRSQVIVVSHAAALVDAIGSARDAVRIELAKEGGETIVAGRNRLDEPPWKWTS
ncbi:MAG TPA: AAA family ATPase [Kofleriaceae bacterium]|nr:AAA family ATPase [Kofleriaceae bacterium]